jgi:hypothetical protein
VRMRFRSSSSPDMLFLFIIFIRSVLETPSATSYWQIRSYCLHRLHRGLVPSHYKQPVSVFQGAINSAKTQRRRYRMACISGKPGVLYIVLMYYIASSSYASTPRSSETHATACVTILRTLAFPYRHCTHATATACRFFPLSGAARRCSGSSEAGAILCHRSKGSMP